MQQGYVPTQAIQQIRCARCGSDRVNVTMVQAKMSTHSRGRGVLWTLMRWMLILATAGLWLLVGKSKGKSNTRIKSEKTALCQNCGNSWTVK